MLRPKIGRIWASSSTFSRRNPGDAKYIQGWLAEIPTYQVLNYLQWKTDTTIQALAERGVLEWGSDVSYSKGAATWDGSDNSIYVALVSNPDSTKSPSVNTKQWGRSAIQITRQSYDDAVAALTEHIADVSGNPHKLTPGRLGTYTVKQIDDLVAKYREMVIAHTNDTGNPHKTAATDVGAVPVEGGEYTGEVILSTGQVLLDSAGNRKVVADDTGVYMANTAGQVGLDDAGYGFVKTGNSGRSKIITDLTFADSKSLTAKDYASPLPLFAMGCIGSTNIDIGTGYVESNFTPTYSAVTGALQMSHNATTAWNITGSKVLTTSTKITIAFDIYASSAGIPEDTANSIQIGLFDGADSDGVYIYSTGASLIRAERVLTGTPSRYESVNYQLTGPVQTWYRVVATFDGAIIKLFIDGVLVNSITNATVTANVGGNKFKLYMPNKTNTAYYRNFNIRNIRTWPEALTDKQVSAL